MKHIFFFLFLLYAGIVSAQKPILEVQVQTRLRGVALLDSTTIRAVRVSPTLSTTGYTGTAADTLCIARQGAATGQVLKWNGSAWAPAADASLTTVQGLATFTPGGTTITIPGTLPTDNAQIWIWRGPMPLLVCPGCGAERVGTSNNFNVSRAIRTGETFSYKIFF